MAQYGFRCHTPHVCDLPPLSDTMQKKNHDTYTAVRSPKTRNRPEKKQPVQSKIVKEKKPVSCETGDGLADAAVVKSRVRIQVCTAPTLLHPSPSSSVQNYQRLGSRRKRGSCAIGSLTGERRPKQPPSAPLTNLPCPCVRACRLMHECACPRSQTPHIAPSTRKVICYIPQLSSYKSS